MVDLVFGVADVNGEPAPAQLRMNAFLQRLELPAHWPFKFHEEKDPARQQHDSVWPTPEKPKFYVQTFTQFNFSAEIILDNIFAGQSFL